MPIQSKIKIESSSFRDPSGRVFFKDNKVFRQVNKSYKDNYELLINSGLYQKLVDKKLLLPHKKTKKIFYPNDSSVYLFLTTDKIPFVSYPYEWSFSQLADAALLTLEIQKQALSFGLSLKDASAYNIQFYYGQPIFIDILSFEKLNANKPWVAYRQFCQHFLAPLALMSIVDVRLRRLLRTYIDGIPLDLTSRLLPKRTYLNFSLLTHIHFHAKKQQEFDQQNKKITKKLMFGRAALMGIVDSLERSILKLRWRQKKSEWINYYFSTNYTPASFSAKKKLIKKIIRQTNPKLVWDLGANTGEFSCLASQQNILTVAFDSDPLVIERNYLQIKEQKDQWLLPLILDLSNPSPSLGWANQERESLINRGPADLVMALALIHHLVISNNIPLKNVADFFSRICQRFLIIEFVPKEDSQIKRMLSNREDIFLDYQIKTFEKIFSVDFKIINRYYVSGSKRTIYLMKKKTS